MEHFVKINRGDDEVSELLIRCISSVAGPLVVGIESELASERTGGNGADLAKLIIPLLNANFMFGSGGCDGLL